MELRIRERADNYIRIALTNTEKEIIKGRAKELGLTITDYLKTCVNEEIKRSEEVK